MLEENVSRLNDQIKELKTSHLRKEDDLLDKIKELKEELKVSETKESEYNK